MIESHYRERCGNSDERQTMQKEELLKYLETNVDENSTIEQIVATFAKMREMPIDGVDEYDDMILFEAYAQNGKKSSTFDISLVRQFPTYYDDEFYQLRICATYAMPLKPKKINECVWSDELDESSGDIFDYVRDTRAYEYAGNQKPLKLEIDLGET